MSGEKLSVLLTEVLSIEHVGMLHLSIRAHCRSRASAATQGTRSPGST